MNFVSRPRISCRRGLPASSRVSHLVGKAVLQVPRAAHQVQFKGLDGATTTLTVEEGDSILDSLLDAGVHASYDCRMGVCMTCPAKLISGKLDQPNSMLSDDVRDEGYTLLCVATPLSDCVIDQITEEEILSKGLKDN